MGYKTEKRIKDEMNRMRKEFEERIARMEKALEEAEKPRPDEPTENKVKEEIQHVKEEVKKE